MWMAPMVPNGIPAPAPSVDTLIFSGTITVGEDEGGTLRGYWLTDGELGNGDSFGSVSPDNVGELGYHMVEFSYGIYPDGGGAYPFYLWLYDLPDPYNDAMYNTGDAFFSRFVIDGVEFPLTSSDHSSASADPAGTHITLGYTTGRYFQGALLVALPAVSSTFTLSIYKH
jgi:hypothetical protein